MEQFDYQEMLDVANELIQETGRQVKLQKYDTVPVDPAKPNLGSTNVSSELPGVWATFLSTKAAESQWGLGFISDDFVKRFKSIALVAGRAEDLKRYTTLIDVDGVVYRIGSAEVLKPGSLTLLYAFGLEQ